MQKGKNEIKEVTEYTMKHNLSGKTYVVTEDYVEKLLSVGYSIIEKKSEVPFDPDPPKTNSTNSDGTKTSPMSRAKQLAQLALKHRKKREEGYVSHAQRKAVWANRADDGKGHPDKKKNESVEEHFNWKVSHGGKDVHVKAPHAGAAVKKAQKGFGNMDLTKAKIKNLGKVGAPTTEATVDTANIRSRQAMKKSDVDKLGKLADMLAKEKKPQKESVQEAKDADGVNIVKDREFKGKPMKKEPDSGKGIKFSDMKPGKHPIKDEVEHIDEVGRMSPKVGKASYTAPAKELKAYAQKSGGMDKKDFMMVADMLEKIDRINILQAGQLLGQLNAKLKNMDTSPREKVLSVLHNHGHNVGNFGGYKMRGESVDEAFYGTQAQRLMSPLQKARQDKEKADRDRDGKLKSTALPIRKKNEENVQELKKSTLGSYIKKASQDAGAKAYSAAQKATSNPDQSGKDYVRSVKRQKGIARATNKLTNEAKSFDQKFRDHLKFSMSKSPAVQAYLKNRRDDRDARHAKQDPAAVKKNYGPAVIPPGTAYNKASKKGMNPSQAANAVSTAFKNRAKRGGKLPK